MVKCLLTTEVQVRLIKCVLTHTIHIHKSSALHVTPHTTHTHSLHMPAIWQGELKHSGIPHCQTVQQLLQLDRDWTHNKQTTSTIFSHFKLLIRTAYRLVLHCLLSFYVFLCLLMAICTCTLCVVFCVIHTLNSIMPYMLSHGPKGTLSRFTMNCITCLWLKWQLTWLVQGMQASDVQYWWDNQKCIYGIIIMT